MTRHNHRELVVVLVGVMAAIACDFRLTNPAGPSVTINNSTSNTNTNTNPINVTPIGPTPTPTPAPGTNTTPGGPRPGDPPVGGVLPLPAGAQGTILSLGQAHAALVQACSYAFVDALVSALRATDTRWGYVCKRGSCAEISIDVVAYHAAAGADVPGATGTYEIDVIGNSCSPLAAPQFLNLGYAATNVFTPTRSGASSSP